MKILHIYLSLLTFKHYLLNIKTLRCGNCTSLSFTTPNICNQRITAQSGK